MYTLYARGDQLEELQKRQVSSNHVPTLSTSECHGKTKSQYMATFDPVMLVQVLNVIPL